MFPIIEFKDFAFGKRKFLVSFLLRVLLVFVTFFYSLSELEEFGKQNYIYDRSPIIYVFAVLQFALIFVCIYFFRKELDPLRSVSGEEFFLFLLRAFLVFLLVVLLLIGLLFGIGTFFKISGETNQEPSIYAKIGEIAVIVILYPILLLYSSISISRLRAIPAWSDFKSVFRDRVFQLLALLVFLISCLIFLFPILVTGLPSVGDFESQYKHVKIRLYIELLPFLIAQILHLGLIFYFVRKFGGAEPETEEEE